MRLEAYEKEENYLPDVVIQEANQFPVADFQQAIKLVSAPGYPVVDFWNDVVHLASARALGGISQDQRPHLASWIKSNWFWFTENWSDRQKYKLTQRLAELTGPVTD